MYPREQSCRVAKSGQRDAAGGAVDWDSRILGDSATSLLYPL